jgi:hypothetical protein
MAPRTAEFAFFIMQFMAAARTPAPVFAGGFGDGFRRWTRLNWMFVGHGREDEYKTDLDQAPFVIHLGLGVTE